MTMIVQYPTKKAFKAAVAKNPCEVIVQDPALMPEWLPTGYANFSLDVLKPGQHICVTNHPKRSWFAVIERQGEGKFKIS